MFFNSTTSSYAAGYCCLSLPPPRGVLLILAYPTQVPGPGLSPSWFIAITGNYQTLESMFGPSEGKNQALSKGYLIDMQHDQCLLEQAGSELP